LNVFSLLVYGRLRGSDMINT